jgi:hypothetical protein
MLSPYRDLLSAVSPARRWTLRALFALVCLGVLFTRAPHTTALRADPISTATLVSMAISAAASYSSFLISAWQQNRRNRKHPIDRGRIDDIRIQTSEYGAPIIRLFGRSRFAGIITDTTTIKVTTATTHGARVKKVRSPDTVDYVYSTDLEILLCAAPVTGLRRMWADADLVYNRDATGAGGGGSGGGGGGAGGDKDVIGNINLSASYPATPDNPADFYHVAASSDAYSVYGSLDFGSWRVWFGSASQPADTANPIYSQRTPAEAVAYRSRCRAMFSIRLKDGRIPNFTFELENGTDPTISSILSSIVTERGLTSGDVDTSALTETVTGLPVTQRQPAKQTVDDLSGVVPFDAVDVDGKLKFVRRDGASVLTIPAGELRAHYEGETPPDFDALVEDAGELSLPNRVEVGHLDPTDGSDYHNNVQAAQRIAGSAQDAVNINLPVVLTPDRARQIAERELYRTWTERRTVSFQTGWKYLKLHPNDVVTLALPNVSLTVRITHMTADLPAGVLKFQGVVTDSNIYSQTATGAAGAGIEKPVVQFAGNQKLVVVESLPLRLDDTGVVAYAWSCLRGDGKFRGAFLHEADPSGTYALLSTFTEQSTIGVTATVLANVSPHSFDATSSLTVDLYNGTLASATQDQLLNDLYLNLLFVNNPAGGEWVQFTTATPSAASFPYVARYTLSGFLRGRFGTDAGTAAHATSQDCVLFDATVQSIRLEASDIGRVKSFKSVSAGQREADASAVGLTVAGTSLKPLSPVVKVPATRNAAGDALIEWVPRTRIAGTWRDSAGVPMPEDEEIYVVEVYAGSTLVRTFRVTVADDATPVTWQVLQKSNNTVSSLNYGDDGSITAVASLANPITFDLVSTARFNKEGVVEFVATSDRICAITLAPAGLPGSYAFPANGTWYFNPNGVGLVQAENDAASQQACVAGDRFSMRLRNGRVEYYKNYVNSLSQPFYTSPNAVPVGVDLQVYGQEGHPRNPSSVASVRLLAGRRRALNYLAAMQAADFGTAQSSIKVRVYQESAIVGRGFYTEEMV